MFFPLDQNVVLFHEIGGFSDRHYPEKESIIALDFYQRESHQEKETPEPTTFHFVSPASSRPT